MRYHYSFRVPHITKEEQDAWDEHYRKRQLKRKRIIRFNHISNQGEHDYYVTERCGSNVRLFADRDVQDSPKSLLGKGSRGYGFAM